MLLLAQVCAESRGVWVEGGQWALAPANGEAALIEQLSTCRWTLEPPATMGGLEVLRVRVNLLSAALYPLDVLSLAPPGEEDVEVRAPLDPL